MLKQIALNVCANTCVSLSIFCSMLGLLLGAFHPPNPFGVSLFSLLFIFTGQNSFQFPVIMVDASFSGFNIFS